MNYGAKLLGASLAILHFLRLCGVLGDLTDMEDHHNHHKLLLSQLNTNPNPDEPPGDYNDYHLSRQTTRNINHNHNSDSNNKLNSKTNSNAKLKLERHLRLQSTSVPSPGSASLNSGDGGSDNELTDSMRRMRDLVNSFCPHCDPVAIDIFFQSTFHPAEHKFSLTDELLSTPFYPESTSLAPAIVDPLCNFADEVARRRPNIRLHDAMETEPEVEVDLASPSAPRNDSAEAMGCRYVENNKTLICDCDSVTHIPSPLPVELELFQVNETQVEGLGRAAFGQSLIKTVKIHANSNLRCIHPHAFQGVRGLRILSISNNNLDYIPLSTFRHLNETYMLYLEHDKINLLTYGRQSVWLEETSQSRLELSGSASGPGSGSTPQYKAHPGNVKKEGGGDWADILDEPVLPALRYLSLMGNPLMVIQKNYFSSLRKSPLMSLILTSCQLRYIHSGALAHFPSLLKLDLSENPSLMPNLDLAFEGLSGSNITTLTLSNNNLDNIPTEALRHIQRTLATLDLSGNLFDALKADSFPSVMNSLKSLNLDNCRIRTIEQATFKNMLNLETLVLTNNRLSHVPVSVGYLTRLTSLDLSYNDPAPSLTLSIGSSPKSFEIYDSLLSTLTMLQQLSLNALPLKEVKADTFKGLVSLDYLSVEGGQIQSISHASFRDLQLLRVLNLAGNRLERITGNTFLGLGKLETLILSGNQINIDFPSADVRSLGWKSKGDYGRRGYGDYGGGGGYESEESEEVLPPEDDDDLVNKTQPFHPLLKLRWLHLNNNRLRTLSPSLFRNLPSLEFVDLSGNSITSWTSRVFNFSITKAPIKELNIAMNYLGPISLGMLQDFQEIHRTALLTGNMDISENPFVCNAVICQLIRMARNGTLSLNNWNDPDSYRCLDTVTNQYKYMCSDFQEICVDTVQPPVTTASPDPVPSSTTFTSSPTPMSTATTTAPPNSTVTSTKSTPTTAPTSTTPPTSPEPEPDPNPSSEGTTAKQTRRTTTSSPPTSIQTDPLTTNPAGELRSPSEEPSSGALFALGLAFLSFLFLSLLLLIGYKKRFHLKYFLFVVRFNLVNIPNLNISKRKASLTSYDYDIFVSYNQADRVFIEDHLLPHVEGEEEEEEEEHTLSLGGQSDSGDYIGGGGGGGGTYNTYSSFDSFDVESLGSRGSEARLTKTLSSNSRATSASSSSSSSSLSHRSSLRVCVHERDFKVGVPITENIVDFVDRSRKVVVVVSRNYLESQWCLYEMNLAYHRLIESGRKSFIVILLEDIPVSLRTKSLNYLLLSRTYIEWPGEKATWSEQSLFWKRLKNSLMTAH